MEGANWASRFFMGTNLSITYFLMLHMKSKLWIYFTTFKNCTSSCVSDTIFSCNITREHVTKRVYWVFFLRYIFCTLIILVEAKCLITYSVLICQCTRGTTVYKHVESHLKLAPYYPITLDLFSSELWEVPSVEWEEIICQRWNDLGIACVPKSHRMSHGGFVIRVLPVSVN